MRAVPLPLSGSKRILSNTFDAQLSESQTIPSNSTGEDRFQERRSQASHPYCKQGAANIYPCMPLSHRWGTERFLKLITRNIRSMQRGFEVSDLPETFSDTITITQRFGVQYLWIDSLCILQDLKEDWRHEAA